MDIQAMFETLILNVAQVATAVVITLLQRWLLELSTPEKDWRWFKRTRFYGWWQSAKWFRGIEAYHQYNSYRLLKGL